jgi:hypothetical protein
VTGFANYAVLNSKIQPENEILIFNANIDRILITHKLADIATAIANANTMSPKPAYINYNPENGQTDAAELADMVNAVNTASAQVRAAGYKFNFNTDRTNLLTKYSSIDWSKVDQTIIQCQNISLATMITDLASFIPAIVASGPNCSIWIQHNTALQGLLPVVKQKMDHIFATYRQQVFGHGFIYSPAEINNTIEAIRYAKALWALIDSGIGTPLTQDPAISLLNHLKNNSGLGGGSFKISFGSFKAGPGSFKASMIASPAAMIYDTKYRNLGGHNGVFVKRRNTPLTYPIYGSARQTQDETFEVVVFAKGDGADDRCWWIKERCKSLINANPTYLIDKGIEWMWNTSWTILPASQNLAQILTGTADPSKTRVYVGRVVLTYDKIVAPTSALNPTAPGLKALQLSRLQGNWTENPCKSVLDYLFTNWAASDPAKGASQGVGPVVFLRNFADAGRSLNKIVVRPSNETSEPETAAQPARDRTHQTLLIDVYTKNVLAHDKRWKANEEIQRIIQSDVAGLWSKGIEEMYLEEFAINEDEPDSDLARNVASASYYSWSTAKLTLAYTLEAA